MPGGQGSSVICVGYQQLEIATSDLGKHFSDRIKFVFQGSHTSCENGKYLVKREILLKMRNTGEKENKITGWKIKRRNKNWRKVLNFITYLLQKLVQQSGNHLEAYIQRHLLWFGTVSFNQRFHAPHHQRGKSPVQCILWPRNSIIKPWKCCEKNKSWRVINSVCFNVFRSIKIIVDTDTVTMWWSDLSNYSCAYVMRKVGPSHCIKSQTYKCRSMGRNILF